MSLLRVVSYNIHKGRSLAGRDSLGDLRLGLHGLRPDLMFLQEVQGRNDKHGSLHLQHESLAAALHMDCAYGCNAVRTQTDHGNALLSRHKILSFENQDISDHRMEQRGLLHGVIDVGGREVHCFVVHLGLFAGSRVRQIEVMAERISRMVPDGAPMVIAGDFNDWRDRLAPLFVEQLGVYEVFAHAPRTHGMMPKLRESMQQLGGVLRGETAEQIRVAMFRRQHTRVNQLSAEGAGNLMPSPRTFPSAFPWLRLDRIYQRGFAVRSARVLRGKPWTQLSDHAPILAELELP
ncbi:MAG: endonuclease/exonuclease/phosphatase family protein [Sheuella sp.]|jgi:endonuclease/exonuclease/phosphatase family metal-dependent hydrolase|nr:endonuclease/exonuclease/phosphatase family protein [Sheuella sp.]